jgi:ABC-type amino acid transport substrate-binding protein
MFKILIPLLFVTQIFGQALEVKVGAYHFPPYAVERDGEIFGITRHLVNELNKIQKDYKFVIYKTSAKNRYEDFVAKKYDMIFFESKVWGWAEHKEMNFTKKILLDGEVFISKSSKDKGQSFFNNLSDKSIAAFIGYHYKFADFNSDEAYLKKNFNIELSKSHLENIKKVRESKVDLGIVTYSFLMKFLNDHPNERKQYLVSENYDQRYVLQFGMRPSNRLNQKKFSQILNKALRAKKIRLILKEYNLN